MVGAFVRYSAGAAVKRFASLLVALAALFPAYAMAEDPVTDSAQHPYIRQVTTDKAVYLPGTTGNVVVSFRNTSGTSFTGNALMQIYLNTALKGQSTLPVTVAPGATTTTPAPFFFAADSGERGYLVRVMLSDANGNAVDTASGAIDVQANILPAIRFPRQCFMSHHDSTVDTASLVASMVAWHCNTIQDYASYYRPELAPPSTLDTWPTLSNLQVSRATIASTIANAHAANMGVLFFQATGEAYNTWSTLNTGPNLSMGSFRRACSTASPCTEADMDRSPTAPDNWTKYGWQADHLDFFDPCNASWRSTLLNKSIRPMLAQFAFDGWQADTVGAPAGQQYDYRGRAINTAACLSDQTSTAAVQLGKPVILNNVSGFAQVDTALTGRQPYIYRETWNYDTPYYPGLNALLYSPFGIRRYTSRPLLTPGYINRTLATNCATKVQTAGCFVNPNTAELATAAFAIAGSSWMNHADDKCLVSNVFVEGYQLPCSPSTVDALLRYKAFEVGYQNSLRDAASNPVETCTITSGATGSAVGAAGAVYTVPKSRPGMQMCHLLNLTGVSSNDWTDLNGTKETPTALGPVTLKMYYVGNAVTTSANKLWWASPDVIGGQAQALTYTPSFDSGGNFITFTVPSLSVWDMIVLETSLIDDNLHIDAHQPIRGTWYSMASNGVSAGSAAALSICCGHGAVYRGVQFGTTAPTQVQVQYGSVNAANITFRLDGPNGSIISTCGLPVTGGIGTVVTRTCPVSGATGLHSVYAMFGDQAVALYSFSFN